MGMNRKYFTNDVFRATGGVQCLKNFFKKQELRFLFYSRKIDEGCLLKPLLKYLRRRITNRTGLEIETKNIGPGLFLVHPFCITVNPNSKIGKNVNLHKGVTIGAENRGDRKGTPILGDCVWVGVNATIVGAVTIGNDVMIAPNTYVNFDVPDHSIVIGEPAKIIHKENATEGYINRKI